MSGTKARTRADDKFDRYAWRDAVYADPKVPTNAKCLAYGIAKHVNGETGEARVGTRTLATVCGCSATWVRNTIPVLHNTGWMVVLEFGRKGRGEDYCNHYSINPEKRTPRVLLDVRQRRVPRAHFSGLRAHISGLKAHPECAEPLSPNPKEERSTPSLSSRVDRDSASKTTVDDAAIYATDRPVPRAAADAARQQPVAAQKQPKPSATAIGTPANVAAVAAAANSLQAGFDLVRLAYPEDRIGDEAKAFFAFARALNARGLSAVLEDFDSMVLDYDGDVPFLADLLETIARMPRQRAPPVRQN